MSLTACASEDMPTVAMPVLTANDPAWSTWTRASWTNAWKAGTATGQYSAEGFAIHNCQWPSPTSGPGQEAGSAREASCS